MKNIGIIGLGLIGGSLGLSLKNNDKYRVLGYDRNEEHIKEAEKLGLVDEVQTFSEIERNSDVIFLAIPVEGIIATLNSFKNLKKDLTIIDMGSTKQDIVSSIPKDIRENFVPAHPMAGTEKSGPSASLKELYRGRVVVLCDLDDSGEKQRKDAFEIFKFLEMRIVQMTSSEHDRHTAWISHLPHLISFSLANSVMAQEGRESILNLSAGGFRDMSRLAKSSPKMWRDIFSQNRENLLRSLDRFKNEVSQFETLIEDSNWEEVEKKMIEANRLHNIF